jgi:hypothetical protein
VPITDIASWYYQSKSRQLQYFHDIVQILEMNHENAEFGRKAQERSPLFMPIARRDGKIHLFAGLNDGYSGSVPISHSILFWNRLCRDYGYTEDIFALEDIIALLT